MTVVAEGDVREVISRGEVRLFVPADAIVTPQANDLAELHDVRIVRGLEATVPPVAVDPARAIARVLLRRSPRWLPPRRLQGSRPLRLSRLAFVGSGMVGATAAHLAAVAGMAAEVVLIDVVPGLAASIALDIEHASGITGSPTRARGGTSLDLVAGAAVVVVTAGRPRTPGMSRGALLSVNRQVVQQVGEAVGSLAPDAVVLVVTNPVDEMTHDLWRASGLADRQVVGMAGTLDSSRFRKAIAVAAAVTPRDVWATTMGSHGPEMVPVVSTATVKGRPLRTVLSPERVAACVREAVEGGAAVVELRRTGSAFIAPAHAIVEVLGAIRLAIAEPLPVSARLHGEYGIDGVFLGVRAVLGPGGVGRVIEDRLDEGELKALRLAADAISRRVSVSGGAAQESYSDGTAGAHQRPPASV